MSVPAAGAVSAATTGSLEGMTVLVVDDELDAREVLSQTLQLHGATVYAADSPTAALAVLAMHTPDVMISDIAMPGEDGYSLMQRVRTLTHDEKRQLPSVALTAFARESDRQRALQAGFDLHLAKPMQAEKLLLAIAQVTRRRLD